MNELGLPVGLAVTPFVAQPLLVAAVIGLGGRVLTGLLLRGWRRLPADVHWTERARCAWPALAATWRATRSSGAP